MGSKLGIMLAHLTVEEITAENGHTRILRLIEEAHEYLKDQRLEQAFDEAIFRGRRERGMTLTAFLTGKKAAFAELRKQGLDLLASSAGRHLLGHLILRQGAFSQDQRQRLKVVTNGSIDFKEVEKAIQKVFGDKLDESAHYDQVTTPRRWRSNTFYGGDDEIDEDWLDEDGNFTYATEWPEEEDMFEDLICLSDNYEAQLIFAQELPTVMDESEALEVLGQQLETVFYETQHRFHHKGKGKGKSKKGKGKGHRTFAGGSPGHGKGGGYLEHRRALQAARNGRGFDRPWQQRAGSRMSLNEMKAKTRCHQCKQLGHWSKECPHRGKSPSMPSRSASSAASTTGAMTTGFFTQPPKVANFGQFMNTTSELEQYMSAPFSGLSSVFLGMHTSEGIALVDTAAQHGLVGMSTLQNHDTLLRSQFGLQVQWSEESGGSVRGICGEEERTRIAYVPIGLAGKSGVLRVQIVPGDIPFLLPAYFLSELGAVIDMGHSTIMYMSLGVKQKMKKMTTGHVAVSIVEFGTGFHAPHATWITRSTAWSKDPAPWTTADLPHAPGRIAPAMGPVATLVAAALCLQFPAVGSGAHGSYPDATTSRSSPTTRTPGAIGEGGTSPSSDGTESASRSCIFVSANSGSLDNSPRRRSSQAQGMCERSWEVSDSVPGEEHPLQPFGNNSRSKQVWHVSEVQQLSAAPEDAFDPSDRAPCLEPDFGLHPGSLLQGPGQEEGDKEQGDQEPGLRGGQSIISEQDNGLQVSGQAEASNIFPEFNGQRRDAGRSSGEFMVRRGGQRSPGDGSTSPDLQHRRGREHAGSAYPSTSAGVRELPPGHFDLEPSWTNGQVGVEVRQPGLQESLEDCGGPAATGTWSASLLQVQYSGAHDQRQSGPGGDGASVHLGRLRTTGLHVRDGGGISEDGDLQHRSSPRLSGWLDQQLPVQEQLDESFEDLLETLQVDVASTYITAGCGESVRGVAPISTRPIISRRVICTHNGEAWSAVSVSSVPGDNYSLGGNVHYLVLYEFMPDFLDYMITAECSTEVTLTKPMKAELNEALDSMLGDQSVYWNLWTDHEAEDDVAEIYGSLVNSDDTIVELYSPPRVVEEARKRGFVLSSPSTSPLAMTSACQNRKSM